jgi:hypothetical protein
MSWASDTFETLVCWHACMILYPLITLMGAPLWVLVTMHPVLMCKTTPCATQTAESSPKAPHPIARQAFLASYVIKLHVNSSHTQSHQACGLLL